MATGTIPKYSSDFYTTQSFNVDVTISTNSYVVQDFTITKSGYTPIGVAGFHVQNKASGGQNVSYCYVRTARIVNSTVGQVSVRNANTSNTAIVNIMISILYIKNQ